MITVTFDRQVGSLSLVSNDDETTRVTWVNPILLKGEFRVALALHADRDCVEFED